MKVEGLVCCGFEGAAAMEATEGTLLRAVGGLRSRGFGSASLLDCSNEQAFYQYAHRRIPGALRHSDDSSVRVGRLRLHRVVGRKRSLRPLRHRANRHEPTLETVLSLCGMVLPSIIGRDLLAPSVAHASVTVYPREGVMNHTLRIAVSTPQQTNPSTFVGGASCGGGLGSRMRKKVLDAGPPPLTVQPEKVPGVVERKRRWLAQGIPLLSPHCSSTFVSSFLCDAIQSAFQSGRREG